MEKSVRYEDFFEIVANWNYRIWEAPHLVIQDYCFDCELNIIFYTIEGLGEIFAKNVADGRIIAIFKHHRSVPTIHYVTSKMILFSAEAEKTHKAPVSLCIWRINDDLLEQCD